MVANPTRDISMSLGYPDGSLEPSVTLRMRTLVTINPTSTGYLAFAIVPGIWGGLAIGNGSGFTATLPSYTNTTTLSTSGLTVFTAAAGTSNSGYIILPYSEQAKFMAVGLSNTARKSALSYNPSKYRVLAQEANIIYSGTTLTDSGSVCVGRFNNEPEYSVGTTSVNTVGLSRLSHINFPITQDAVVALPGSQIFAAREAYKIKTVNVNPRFQQIHDDSIFYTTTGTTQIVSAFIDSATSLITNGGAFGFDENLPFTVASYANLDSTSSITVELNSVVEIALGPNSNINSFATPNPPAPMGLLNKLQNLFRDLPVASMLRQGVRALNMLAGPRVDYSQGRLMDEL